MPPEGGGRPPPPPSDGFLKPPPPPPIERVWWEGGGSPSFLLRNSCWLTVVHFMRRATSLTLFLGRRAAVLTQRWTGSKRSGGNRAMQDSKARCSSSVQSKLTFHSA